MSFEQQSFGQPSIARGAAINKVIKNTYILLSATLLFSALTAGISMVLQLPGWTYLAAVLVSMVLGIFVLPRTANSSAGIGVIFLITGLLGLGLGPVISTYLALPNGGQVVALALGGTGVIFLGLSGYALTSQRDFSFLGGFVFTGMLVVLLAGLVNLFLGIPALQLAIASVTILVMSAYILFQTSIMVQHGEAVNYIEMTYGLYLSIFNIFISLLQILGFFSDE